MTSPVSNDPKVPIIKTTDNSESQTLDETTASIMQMLKKQELEMDQQMQEARDAAVQASSAQAKRRNLGNLGNRV